MADLVLDWGALGPYGYNLTDTAPGAVTASVDTGGVAVDITFTAQAADAQAFTVSFDGHVPAGSGIDPNSHLKLFGSGGTGGGTASATSTAVLDFRATSGLFGDDVRDLRFVLNDIDAGPRSDLGDLGYADEGGSGFRDDVTILAYDAAGNPVDVTLTALGAGPGIAGASATGTGLTAFAGVDGTVLVSIDGPVSRIEVVYANGGDSAQAVLISDLSFSTTDPEGEEEGGNSDPVANDDLYATVTGVAVTFDPTANDIDPDGDPLRITTITDPVNGTITPNDDGTLTYTPVTGFTGEDSFSYTVVDGNGGSDTARIVITVGDDTLVPAGERIDTDIFPVGPDLQALDPFDGLDQDPDPFDDLDSVTGTEGADTIDTGDDADTILGGGGDDVIRPGIDNDFVDAGDGADYVTDLQGSDTVIGGAGNDTIIAGVDTFSDYESDDPAFPTLGFLSDPNTDDGRDSVEGGDGDDSLLTGDDADSISGGAGNDFVDGGIDDDLISGDAGADTLLGRHGSDTIAGGLGDDLVVGSGPAGLAIPDAGDPQALNDRDLLSGDGGNDTLFGGDDDDTLLGGTGNDRLDGGIDEDSLSGGDGDDTLIGGQGADTIDGGDGRDTILGATAGDRVDGGSGPAGTAADGRPNDWDTLNLTGSAPTGGRLRVIFTSEDREDGYVEFYEAGGDAPVSTMTFEDIENVVPCFTPGTLIATPQGERMVEDLGIGDRVITRDNGIQEIRWVGRKDLTGHQLARQPHLRPILIQQGALGNNLPEHDLMVSPNHRILVANDKTSLYFEEREVLAAAKHLTGLDGVDEVGTLGVSYIHFMFDQHEVVLSNGAWTESFQPGDYTLKGIGNAQRQEILELFPDLEHQDGLRAYGAARRSLKRHEAELLTR